MANAFFKMKRNTIIIFLCLPLFLFAQYNIKGTLEEKGKWNYVHFQYVRSLDDLTHANMNQIIQSVRIDSLGHFEISGYGLPEGEHLYMLLLGKKSTKEGGFGITNGFIKNYSYLILKEPMDLEIICPDTSESFAGCGFRHSPKNAVLARLTDEIIPSIYAHIRSTGERHETGVEFFHQKMDNELKNFADTCQYLLPAMVALKKMNDLETDYESDPVFYENFLKRLEPILNTSPYAIEFATKIESWQRIYFGEEKQQDRAGWLYFFMALSGLLLTYVLYLRKQIKTLKTKEGTKDHFEKKSLDALSTKELEVFNLITKGKSNKEIAQALFIEPSTVKSHVNKIFQKLGVKSRKEIIKHYKPM